MPAAVLDLVEERIIEQGATYRLSFIWRHQNENGTPGDPIDLEGCIARMQIRKAQKSPIIIALDSETIGGITLGAEPGRVDIFISDDQTDLLVFKTGFYDLEIEMPNTEVERVLKGKVAVDPNITQEVDDPPQEA